VPFKGNASTATVPAPAISTRPVDDLAREVIRGNWGNGDDRRRRLTAAGHDPAVIQKRVNEMLRE